MWGVIPDLDVTLESTCSMHAYCRTAAEAKKQAFPWRPHAGVEDLWSSSPVVSIDRDFVFRTMASAV